MFSDWSWIHWILLLVIAGLVAYWAALGALISFVQRDMRRRGAPDWLGWAFVLSTPLGVIVWLIARVFFPLKDDPDS